MPEYGAFTSHLKPIVLIALNTGMRRGEIFNLRWSDVDFGRKGVTVEGSTAKGTRHIPLNNEAYPALVEWTRLSSHDLVFPGDDSGRLDNINKSWRSLMRDAKIAGYRFHDCRHEPASWSWQVST